MVNRRWTTVVSRLIPAYAGTIVVALLLVALVAGATWKLTLGDRIIARGDLLLYFYPLRDYASQAIREGRLPLWNPYTFMGAPFLANSQVGFFYPFNVITAWLPVARAVSWNIALHLVIAAIGAYALARVGFRLSGLASFACGIAFGLGGYLGAQIEHLNQLQVLAWLPLMVLVVSGQDETRALNVTSLIWRVLALTLLLALQILAGHTQSLYICLATLGIVTITQCAINVFENRASLNAPLLLRSLVPLLVVCVSAVLAAPLCAIQLLPALELSTQSARSGGLPFNEAGSFSWRPWVIARALLPTYGDPLFPEYVAYFGAFGLALALLGIVVPARRLTMNDERPSPVVHRPARPEPVEGSIVPIVLVLVGFILALGIVTPFFNVLYRFMPGFNLFRAQVRWLIVFTLGASLLIGLGAQALQDGLTRSQCRRWLIAWLVLIVLMVTGLLLGVRISPEPEYLSLPARPVLIGWAVAAAVVTFLILACWGLGMGDWRLGNLPSLIPSLFVIGLVAELLLASQFQPYARVSDRQALTSLRPATAHLLADLPLTQRNFDSTSSPARGEGRILALSSLFFDPGDMPEQRLIYQSQLSEDEVYDRIIASKHKEILSPNLSLYYRLPSADGYDGGLLPLKRYAEFVKQFASTPTGTIDGRLREFLKGVPANEWLEKMAVRYILADKTQDVFIDGVYYDLLFSEPLVTGTLTVPLQPYSSTALGLVFSVPGAKTDNLLARARVRFDDGTQQVFDIHATEAMTQPYLGVRLKWQWRRTPTRLDLAGLQDLPGQRLRGITSIDETDKTFLPQMVTGDHDMRVVHSGDVKIYENLKPAARFAFRQGDTETRGQGEVRLIKETPELLQLEVIYPTTDHQSPVFLIVRDACYPGWVAHVDGVETPITCTDILFRSVPVPAGKHQVTFTYEPESVRIGAIVSVVGIMLCLLIVAITFRVRRSVLSLPDKSMAEEKQ